MLSPLGACSIKAYVSVSYRSVVYGQILSVNCKDILLNMSQNQSDSWRWVCCNDGIAISEMSFKSFSI